MSSDKKPGNVYLCFDIDINQETDQMPYDMAQRYHASGKFCGAYEFNQGDKIIPILCVQGLTDADSDLGNTHLLVTTVPKSQKKGQPCSPFTDNYIANTFRKFLPVTQADFTDEYIINRMREKKGIYYIPEISESSMVVSDKFLQDGAKYFYWSMTGYLALDRKNSGMAITEPLLRFDPEVIVDTGRHH